MTESRTEYSVPSTQYRVLQIAYGHAAYSVLRTHFRHPVTLSPRHLAILACLLLAGCGWDGHFSVLGYHTQPNYDLAIRTVRVPIFKNETFRRGFEFELTRAVIREIEAKTPYKVVSGDADTELTGTIISVTKGVLNRNQLNEVRESEVALGVQIIWRHLGTGEILSKPRTGPGAPPPPPPPGAPPVPPPVTLVADTSNFVPELGESITTAQKRVIDKLAVKIVSQMEIPW